MIQDWRFDSIKQRWNHTSADACIIRQDNAQWKAFLDNKPLGDFGDAQLAMHQVELEIKKTEFTGLEADTES